MHTRESPCGVRFAAVWHPVVATGARLPAPNPAFCAIREFAEPDLTQQAALGRLHLAKGTLKHRKARVRARYAQRPAPSVADDARSLVHQLLHHRLDAPAQCHLAHWAVALVQRVLAHDAQQVHRHRRQRAHQVVGGKLARGQAIEIHVGLELGMELFMGGVVAVQRDDLFVFNLWPQRGAPALEHVLGKEQGLALLVEGALSQAVDAPQRWAASGLDVDGFERLAPQALAFAHSELRPRAADIGAALDGNLLHRRTARVPFDQQIELSAQCSGTAQCLCDQVLRAKARIGAQQQGCLGHRTGGAQGALDVVFALARTVLAARAQIELQAVAARAQVQGDGAVAIDPGVGVGDALFLGVACGP